MKRKPYSLRLSDETVDRVRETIDRTGIAPHAFWERAAKRFIENIEADERRLNVIREEVARSTIEKQWNG